MEVSEMIRPLFTRNLRHHLVLLIVLLAWLALVELLIVWIVGHIERGPGVRQLFEQVLPLGMQQVLGSQLGMLSFTALAGFGFQHPLALAGAIAFVIAVATVPAGERESGFLDLVMARPVPRVSYFFAVLLLLLLGAFAMPLAPLLGLRAGLGLLQSTVEIEWSRYAPGALGLACILLTISGYTMLLASFARRRGTAAAQATALTLIFFWIDLLSPIWEPIRAIDWISPFHYFKPVRSAITGDAPWDHYLLLLGISLITTALALLIFRRRDF
jgi:ABC-2 type transport system permease protein